MTTHPAQGSAGVSPVPTITPLILDFLQWLAPRPRPYAEVMESWRTSCPRLPIWEDAVDQGLVARERAMVSLSAEGQRMLRAFGRD